MMSDAENQAMTAMHALSQPTRLSAFRLLVDAGPDGLSAGDIAEELGVPQSTLSFHLGLLERSGLLVSVRYQRLIVYSVNPEGAKNLVRFLIEDLLRRDQALIGFDPSSLSASPWSRRKNQPSRRR